MCSLGLGRGTITKHSIEYCNTPRSVGHAELLPNMHTKNQRLARQSACPALGATSARMGEVLYISFAVGSSVCCLWSRHNCSILAGSEALGQAALGEHNLRRSCITWHHAFRIGKADTYQLLLLLPVVLLLLLDQLLGRGPTGGQGANKQH